MPGSPDSPPRRSITYRFGPFQLDPDLGVLTRNGRNCRIQHKAFELLCLLVRNPGRLLVRDEVIRALWPDTVVDFEHGLNTLVRKVRSALGDSASRPAFIETVPRKGYRFIGEVERVGTAGSPPPAGPVSRAPRPGGRPMRTVVGVLLALVMVALGDLPHGKEPRVPAGDAGLQADLSQLLKRVEPCAYCRSRFAETGRLYDCAWCRARLAAVK